MSGFQISDFRFQIVSESAPILQIACHPERSSVRAKAGRNAVEGPRRFSAILPVNPRDPSAALRPPFRLRSAQDDTRFGVSVHPLKRCADLDSNLRSEICDLKSR